MQQLTCNSPVTVLDGDCVIIVTFSKTIRFFLINYKSSPSIRTMIILIEVDVILKL